MLLLRALLQSKNFYELQLQCVLKRYIFKIYNTKNPTRKSQSERATVLNFFLSFITYNIFYALYN